MRLGLLVFAMYPSSSSSITIRCCLSYILNRNGHCRSRRLLLYFRVKSYCMLQYNISSKTSTCTVGANKVSHENVIRDSLSREKSFLWARPSNRTRKGWECHRIQTNTFRKGITIDDKLRLWGYLQPQNENRKYETTYRHLSTGIDDQCRAGTDTGSTDVSRISDIAGHCSRNYGTASDRTSHIQ